MYIYDIQVLGWLEEKIKKYLGQSQKSFNKSFQYFAVFCLLLIGISIKITHRTKKKMQFPVNDDARAELRLKLCKILLI